MKFGKEFVSQMVPEWQEAYMNYNYVKTVLKDILHFKQRNKQLSMGKTPLKRRGTLYRAFSGLTRRCSNLRSGGSPKKDEEDDEVILVNAVQQEEGGSEGYETMFLMWTDEGGEHELIFFRILDDEFNKVLKFYKAKVEGVMQEATELNKQMDALIALRIKVENPQVQFEGGCSENLAADIVASSPATAFNPMSSRIPGKTAMDVISEVEMSNERQSENEDIGVNEAKTSNNRFAGGENMNINGFKPAPLEVLKHVKINIVPETPRSTIKGIIRSSNSDFSFSKEELGKVEEQIVRAFIEFYQKLRLLKSYSFLNQLAFFKIMKKYDKITSRKASKAYLKMVDGSYLGSSDEVTRLMERVEATFIKHFANGNHRNGMNFLRPQARKERHRLTFFLGLLTGCTLALIVAIVLLIHARNIFKSKGSDRYMESMFPLYSLFGFVVLHMLMFSANIFFWRRYRINFPFIFGFKQGTELGFREVFLLSTGLAVLALAGILSNLEMDIDPHTQGLRALTELVPLGLVIVVLLITFCPFNILYRSSRFFLLKCTFHCICAPLYKVTLPDFFLGDQLTSQVQAFRSLEFYICYYGWGDYKRRTNRCHDSNIFNTFYYIVAVVPYWVRLLQCLRCLFEERDAMQGWNGLKYLSTITAVVMRTGYDQKRKMTWKIMAGASSAIATLANTYWDLVIDWGLLQRNSKNHLLRDKILVSNKSVYFVAMALNVLLRFAWMQSVLGFREFAFLHRTAVTAIVACLEIIRRGIWNFFRLENEHLNNVGKYRAFKSVPLPFNYDEDEDKDL